MRTNLRLPSNLFFLAIVAALLGSPACARPAPEPGTAQPETAQPETTQPEPDRSEPAPVVAIEPALLLPNGAEPFPGLITGGQPTLEQLEAASAAGIKTVINLRMPGESDIGEADVEARGMTYVSFPIASDDLSAEKAAAFAAAVEAAERPAIVHCGSGNRVGALFALKAYYEDGVDPEAAIALGRTAGLTRMEAPVREHLAGAAHD